MIKLSDRRRGPAPAATIAFESFPNHPIAQRGGDSLQRSGYAAFSPYATTFKLFYRHAVHLSLSKWRWFVDLIDDMLNNVSVKSYPFPTICQNPADLLDSSTRPEIRCPHPKDNMIHKRKGVVQHESLHPSVEISTPIGAGEERPADLKFARLSCVPEVQ